MIYLLTLCFDVLIKLAGLIMVAIGLLFERDNHLPKLFKLWDNTKYGCNGGNFWLRENGENTSFIAKWKWLALRNPAYGWSEYAGYESTGIQTINGNPNVSRTGDEGYYFAQDGTAWEFHFIKAYGTRCIKLRFGWKILGAVESEICRFVFSPNPFTSYKKKG